MVPNLMEFTYLHSKGAFFHVYSSQELSFQFMFLTVNITL